jgi:SHS2 domain-containing protein
MMADRDYGFIEIEHTADWALKVWAPNLEVLFSQAAQGLYWLMEIELAPGPRVERVMEVDGMDAESRLVNFLSELLYLGESEGLGFDQFEVSFQEDRLRAEARGAPMIVRKKEIKAVTYHNLAIRRAEGQYIVTIVFDV